MSEEEPVDLLPSGTIMQGRYRVERCLGYGGMGVVYEATNTIIHQRVAIKCLRAERAQSERAVRRLIQEARSIAAINHDHIVRVLDFWRADDGQVSMVMEFLDGETLLDRMKVDPPLSLEAVLTLMIQLCDGLHAAHARGIIHRDLKPENIFLLKKDGGQPFAKIVDFGVSKMKQEDNAHHEPITLKGMRVGTPRYMAPEQIMGREDADHRVDMYALGVLLHEMLTGEVPFDAHAWPALVYKVCTEDPPSLRERVPTIPEGLETVYQRLLSKTPDDRYPDCRSLKQALIVLRQAVQPQSTSRFAQASLGLDSLSWSSDSFDEWSDVLTSERPPPMNTNLLPELDAFVGRVAQMERLSDLLLAREGSSVTLIGGAGSGKTRLSERFGRMNIDEFEGGVWFCDLTQAEDAAGIVNAVSDSIGIPITEVNGMAQLGHALAGRGSTLLILDGFEHLREHAAATVGAWAMRATEARFLLTTRVRLDLPGSVSFPLDPLSEEEAVALFHARALEANPSYVAPPEGDTVVGDIAHRLDYMALAIELCAARTRMLPPSALLARLDERFKLLRQARSTGSSGPVTLEGVFDESWELLQPHEQAVLSQASVFRGGFRLAAAEYVFDLSEWPDAPYVMDILQSLVDHSLIRVAEPVPGTERFSLTESVREYAAQKLKIFPAPKMTSRTSPAERATEPAPSAPSDILSRTRLSHARHYASFGEDQYVDSLMSEGGHRRLRNLALDTANLIAGRRFAAENESLIEEARCTLASLQIYIHGGRIEDGWQAPRALLDNPALPKTLRGNLLHATGRTLIMVGQLDDSQRRLEAARAIGEESGDARLESLSLGALAYAITQKGKLEEARTLAEQAIQVAESGGEHALAGMGQSTLAYIELRQGLLPECKERYQHAIAIHRVVGNRRFEGIDIRNLGMVHKQMGRLDSARESYEEALEIFWETHSPQSEGLCFESLGLLDAQQGDLERAQKHLEHALDISREVGLRHLEGNVLGNIGDVVVKRGRGEEAEQYFRDAIAICDQTFPAGAGSFRGSAALLRAEAGDFAEARALLARGEEQLSGIWAFEHGKLLCKRAQVELMAGDRPSASAAYEAAKAVAQASNIGSSSELGEAIAALRGQLE